MERAPRYLKSWKRVDYDAKTNEVGSFREIGPTCCAREIEEKGVVVSEVERRDSFTHLVVILTWAGDVLYFLVRGDVPAQQEEEFIARHQKEQLVRFVENFGGPWEVSRVVQYEDVDGLVIGYHLLLKTKVGQEVFCVRTYGKLAAMVLAYLGLE